MVAWVLDSVLWSHTDLRNPTSEEVIGLSLLVHTVRSPARVLLDTGAFREVLARAVTEVVAAHHMP